tara:strand:+ start:64 stop:468 length:405 start_codon:yes stop_codon:yes gene_type:complete
MPRDLHTVLEGLRAVHAEAGDALTKTRLRATEKLLLSLSRQLDFEKRRGAAELQALRAELQEELIAREANAARVAEKQRAAFDTSSALPGALHGLDRAAASAAFIDVALRALDVHAQKNIGETDILVGDVSERP